MINMRKYIRHPTGIPIEYQLKSHDESKERNMKNVSVGGLCFQTHYFIDKGSELLIKIPTVKPPFAAESVVVWCQQKDGVFNVGVQFNDSQTQFRMRMVEQICHIEEYRKKVLEIEDRSLTSEEAAFEWINKHAENFSQYDP